MPGGFPFDAPNGAAGHAPTNELVNGTNGSVDHGSRSAAVTHFQSAQPNQSSDPAAEDGHIAKRWTNTSDAATPPGRRSVQFARSATENDAVGTSHSRQESGSVDDVDILDRGRQASFFAKLKAYATPTPFQPHLRSSSGFTIGDSTIDEYPSSAAMSSASERNETRHLEPYDEESEVDADAEESAGEGSDNGPGGLRRRRRSRRPLDDGYQTAPTTPKGLRFPSSRRESPTMSPSLASANRPSFLPRRATMTDIPEDRRAGVSEDEGRERLAQQSAWRRGLHNARGLTYHNLRHHENSETPSTSRPSQLRRFTGMVSGSNGADNSPSPFRLDRAHRMNSSTAQQFRKVQAGLRLFGAGRRRKDERTQVDHQKSAELMAELLAGTPAAVLFASMIQRDEHGHRRIPVLLEQLKIKITDTKKSDARLGERHTSFRIELEYGNGPTRMNWVINRGLREFLSLHAKYKYDGGKKYVKLRSDDTSLAKLPHFPRSAFPVLKTYRGLADEDEKEDDEPLGAGGNISGVDGEASGTDRPGKPRRRRTSYSFTRRKSSTSAVVPGGGTAAGAQGTPGTPRQTFAERQRQKLETYLQQLIRWLIFRPDSNRLCRFLELSALGVRLASEGGYHGKEGALTIKSANGVDHRRTLVPSNLRRGGRNRAKWFLVRQSYLVCVDSPEDANIYDVFLVDPEFSTVVKRQLTHDQSADEALKSDHKRQTTQHSLRITNSERRMRLGVKNERLMKQFVDSITLMKNNTEWAKQHRYESFAPLRHRVFAQWLVDGRDYMWNLSRAISQAKDVIFIHDWWLSPELYLRRPAAISQKWRLDRLLKRKAEEGVKVFVIVYRNVESATPIGSEYTKYSLLDLHDNVMVQRSPNQFRQNQFFWAHHEKLCIVDHSIAFCGGIDLCYGRWDTPGHSLIDDKLTGFELDAEVPRDADHCQMWPGKDYSNPRVQDFYALDRPYEEMYDRTRVPRMPWHDIGMQIVGQPARDLCRHFVQRWNYILRQRKPSRPIPFLLPPPDFKASELETLGLTGTCDVQMLRSCCSWSIGTPNKVEHSIMNAYVDMIRKSEHFVYVENQFFISSCEVEGTKMHNTIGDALVERIIKAHNDGDEWRACLIIPLMPGFQNSVDQQDGTSVRLIMQCQYRSICRGSTSIFGRLQEAGIEPEDYIHFYALRQWGKIGPRKALTTEQLYIHAKCMIVDDRVAIIGSANINERSMLGSRDSEVAAIISDTKLIPSLMGGVEYQMGEFAHSLRKRLMREHLGLDLDEIQEEERDGEHSEYETGPPQSESSSPPSSLAPTRPIQHVMGNVRHTQSDPVEGLGLFQSPWLRENVLPAGEKKSGMLSAQVDGVAEHDLVIAGYGVDNMAAQEAAGNEGGRDTILEKQGHEVLISDSPSHGRGTHNNRLRAHTVHTARASSKESRSAQRDDILPPRHLPRMDTRELGLTQLSQLPPLPVTDDTDIGGPPLTTAFSKASASVINPLVGSLRRPYITKDCMTDPLNDSFYLDTWHAVAENNTKLYRQVFRCMPDNEVKSWKEYKEYNAYNERFMQAQGLGKSMPRMQQEAQGKSGPPGAAGAGVLPGIGAAGEKIGAAGKTTKNKVHGMFHRPSSKASKNTVGEEMSEKKAPMGTVCDWAEAAEVEARQRGTQGSRNSFHELSRIPSTISARIRTAVSAGDDEAFDEKAAQRAQHEADIVDRQNAADIEVSRDQRRRSTTVTYATHEEPALTHPATNSTSHTNGDVPTHQPSAKKRARRNTRGSMRHFHASDDMLDKDEAEQLLKLVQGHLVLWPYDWLAKEEKGGNWLYNIDQIAPLEIYD
ncbi:hypothetical protein B0A49_07115 [Cryomyces minteri]|uniref:Phospholipase D1 n=1 Tax=Cryomyces minteri TaxID=331657 RepID=A0A4U0XBF4_9PEZI|nr:hypothetical protein B0A49_07115 [Cryomyces minteri]